MEQITGFLDTLGRFLTDLWFGLWSIGLRKFALLVGGIIGLTVVVTWLANRAGAVVSHKH
jgi:hypothetical protein